MGATCCVFTDKGRLVLFIFNARQQAIGRYAVRTLPIAVSMPLIILYVRDLHEFDLWMSQIATHNQLWIPLSQEYYTHNPPMDDRFMWNVFWSCYCQHIVYNTSWLAYFCHSLAYTSIVTLYCWEKWSSRQMHWLTQAVGCIRNERSYAIAHTAFC